MAMQCCDVVSGVVVEAWLHVRRVGTGALCVIKFVWKNKCWTVGWSLFNKRQCSGRTCTTNSPLRGYNRQAWYSGLWWCSFFVVVFANETHVHYFHCHNGPTQITSACFSVVLLSLNAIFEAIHTQPSSYSDSHRPTRYIAEGGSSSRRVGGGGGGGPTDGGGKASCEGGAGGCGESLSVFVGRLDVGRS